MQLTARARMAADWQFERAMPPQNINESILRIIDAAQNRAGEGLRVIEDYCRLHLQDLLLFTTAKQLRHDLTQSLTEIATHKLLQSRNTSGDIGTAVEVSSEYQRNSEQQIVRANFARVQQALRTIEEYAKTFNANIARNIEQIRYACYTLEKVIANTPHSRAELESATLYVLTDLRESMAALEALIQELIAGQVELIQLRDKTATDAQLVRAGRLLTKLTRNSKTRWIMNDRPDLAVVAAADGVHVGQDDLSVADVRAIVGSDKIIGVSTHTIEQARTAVLLSPTYIAVGPVFPSATKSFATFANETFLRQVVSEISLPTFAIGGIDEQNMPKLIAIGIQRIAISHAVVDAESPPQTIAALKALLATAPKCNTVCCPSE